MFYIPCFFRNLIEIEQSGWSTKNETFLFIWTDSMNKTFPFFVDLSHCTRLQSVHEAEDRGEYVRMLGVGGGLFVGWGLLCLSGCPVTAGVKIALDVQGGKVSNRDGSWDLGVISHQRPQLCRYNRMLWQGKTHVFITLRQSVVRLYATFSGVTRVAALNKMSKSSPDGLGRTVDYDLQDSKPP